MADKILELDYPTSGLENCYVEMRHHTNSTFLDSLAAGTFAALPVTFPDVTEDADRPGVYRAVITGALTNGFYPWRMFRRVGAAQDRSVDQFLGDGVLRVENNAEWTIPVDASGYVKSSPQTSVTVNPDQAGAKVIAALAAVTEDDAIAIVRGNTITLEFTLPTDSGWDLTGKDVYCCIKLTPTTPNASAIVNRLATVTGAKACSISLTALETAAVDSYVGALEVWSGGVLAGECLHFGVRITQDRRQ